MPKKMTTTAATAPVPTPAPGRARPKNSVAPSVVFRRPDPLPPRPGDTRSQAELDEATAALVQKQVALSKNRAFRRRLRDADAKLRSFESTEVGGWND